ncbi:hypothetical protein PR002_g3799 [Phytophthora rubi]|uniref:PiggyBac transposable element-derived protein domain-containing protein n=1 Tax=Phytophthora rubi TaxID=129364 RepID=A0A6A3NH36_9STRA|nr:hypothetical protein PR002_g3799 [Phytophthora rubi]
MLGLELRRHKHIKAHEMLQCVGLLISRMLCPQKRRFSDHWSTVSVGVVPVGMFGRVMSRNRFAEIMRNIHFTNNAAANADTDRAWKVRSISDTLQKTFKAGYNIPGVLAFDEAMIPSQSDSSTAYCLRLEVYCGKAHHTSSAAKKKAAAESSGPAAKEKVFFAVVTDRFYTSIRLALELLTRNVYSVGTILPSRAGFSDLLTEKNRNRPKTITRGTVRMGVAKALPQLGAMVWRDQKPVHVLATGASRAMLTCERRISGGKGRTTTVSCSSMIRDYQTWMGGVDVHDQLRLQRYSLQLAVMFTKYYKTIALGMIDMAITNAYICQREARKAEGKPAAVHAKFLLELHAQLVAMTDADFADTMFSPGPATPTRELSPTTAHSLTADDE